jgi:uracil-DNA glycosylase
MKIFGLAGSDVVNRFMPAWYLWDFSTSPGYKRMSKVFGEDWLFDKRMLWSNVVRCRTSGNATPSREMLDNCKTWTSELLSERKAVVMVGLIAKDAILGPEAAKLEWGVPRRHPKFGIVLAIRHYSTWEGDEEKTYREAFKRVLEAVGV